MPTETEYEGKVCVYNPTRLYKYIYWHDKLWRYDEVNEDWNSTYITEANIENIEIVKDDPKLMAKFVKWRLSK